MRVTAATGSAARRGARVPRVLGMLVILLLLAGLARPIPAEEPLLTIMKNTLLGGATGLILGGTLTLVVDEDSRSEVIRWGVVIGTFSGFGLGAALAWRGEEDLFPGGYGDDDSGGSLGLQLAPGRASLLAERRARQLRQKALRAPAPAKGGRCVARLTLLCIRG